MTRTPPPRRSKPPHARGAGSPPRPAAPWREAEEGPLYLYGVHAIEAALANPDRKLIRLLATENAARRLGEGIARRGVGVEAVSPRDLDRLLGPDTVHQGVALETEPLPEPGLDELVRHCLDGQGPIIVLDQVTDPHNVGAILRSAAVLGTSGLVMTRRHSPPLNGTLAKTASGALELVPVAPVGNLARALAEIGEAHILRLGLDGAAETAIEDVPMGEPIALVLGAEGKGLRQLTRESCDRLVRVAASGPLASLNVSNAAAIALHLAALRRRGRV